MFPSLKLRSVSAPIFSVALLACVTSVASAQTAAKWPEPTKEGLDFFESEVRPILVNSCYQCHSTKSGKIKGDLVLDSWAGISKGGTNGAAIIPGNPDKSPLIQGIRGEDKDFQMPPKDKLPEQIQIILERWVKMGAPYPRNDEPATSTVAYKKQDMGEARKQWQYQPVPTVPVPTVKNASWSAHPIDKFLLQKWEARGITPPPPADKRTLLRRATFDLTGLPPTPQEMAAFVADTKPDAFAKVVERLLASPAYGERWGRHWLDVVRYADTGGDSADYPIPEARFYRDYVIDSFNADKPYTKFLTEQLAGDLLPAKTEAQRREQLVATGYLAISRRFGVQPQMELTIDDTIDNVSKAMLGLTVSCARCHDHKFDPIPTKDYYALFGIFSSTKYPFPGSENIKRPSDFVPLEDEAEAAKKLAPFKDKIAELEANIKKISEEQRKAKKAASTATAAPTGDPAQAGPAKTTTDFRKMLANAERERVKFMDTVPKIEVAYAVSEANPRDEAVRIRGEASKKGEVVPRHFLSVLGGEGLTPAEAKTSGRLALAEWITDAQNPLTARVYMNRLWAGHFGRGIVATTNDFGKQSKPATHPELLDFLASWFARSGYSIKTMHRVIMSSRAYQMTSAEDPANAAKDGTNETFWHFQRQRLQAEQIRDTILAVSGELDRSRPGAHPFPPPEKWDFTQHKAFAAVYENNYRSVYQMTQRIKKHPFLGLFDGADANASTGERAVSTTPLQSLFFMNDPFIRTQSEKFADMLIKQTASDPQRIVNAYWLAYQRGPMPDEAQDASGFVTQFISKKRAENSSATPAELSQAAYAALGRTLFASNEFLFND